MAAAALPPVEHYTFFLKSLLETVRVNIGECAAASYSVLSIEAATKVLMFNNEKVQCVWISECSDSICFCRRYDFTLLKTPNIGNYSLRDCQLSGLVNRGKDIGAERIQKLKTSRNSLAKIDFSEPVIRHRVGENRLKFTRIGVDHDIFLSK